MKLAPTSGRRCSLPSVPIERLRRIRFMPSDVKHLDSWRRRAGHGRLRRVIHRWRGASKPSVPPRLIASSLAQSRRAISNGAKLSSGFDEAGKCLRTRAEAPGSSGSFFDRLRVQSPQGDVPPGECVDRHRLRVRREVGNQEVESAFVGHSQGLDRERIARLAG